MAFSMLVQPLRVTHRSPRHPQHQHPPQQHSHHLDHDHDSLDTFQVHAIHWGGKQHGGDWRRWSQVSWKGIPLGHRSPLFIFLIRSVGTGTIPCSEHRGQQPLRLHGPEKPRASSPHAGPQRGKSPLYSSKPPTILHLTQKTKIVAPSKLPPGDSLCPLRELPVHEAAADDEQSANCKTFDHQCKTGDISHQKC